MFRSASEILAFNPKIDAIHRMCDGSIELNDSHLFPLANPPPPQERPNIDHQTVYTSSPLCRECKSALSYFAYVVEECKAKKVKARTLNLLEVALHHEDLISLFSSAQAGCHLCLLLSGYVKGPGDERSAQFQKETRVEMCWSTEFDEKESLDGHRLQFAEFRTTGPRYPNDYFIFARLQIWPAKKFGHLFATQGEFEVVESDFDGPGGNVCNADDTYSASAPEDFDPASSSSGRSSRAVSDTNESASPTSRNSKDNNESSDDVLRIARSSTGSASSQQLARLWLSHCRNNKDGLHGNCCNLDSDDWLPTRLIDIKHAQATSAVRLMSPYSTPNAFVTDRRYVTLSHCWGTWGPKAIPVLKVANERERFEKGISLELLPQTFRDAIEVAAWLEVPWLWIDSLCIIQDSSVDWQQEAIQMHSVYAQGYLNISADCAVDARDGLFQSRAAMAIQPLELELPGIDETIYLTVDERNLFNWISDAPLSQRAWVFQERHLARRILHFTEREIVWECCANAPYFASETFPNPPPLKRVFDNKPKLQARDLLSNSSTSPAELYDLWEDLCQMYSEKYLSKASDKLIALFGLAKIFQKCFPDDTYIAGMWVSTLPHRLLWDVEGGPPIERSTGVAPSWSWASIDGPVKEKYRFKSSSEERVAAVCKIDYTSQGTKGVEPLDGIQSSELAVNGFILRVTIQDNLLRDDVFPPIFENRRSLVIHHGPRQVTFADVNFSYSLDSSAQCKTTEAYLLFITIHSEPHKRVDVLHGLLLLESKNADTFERIGTFSTTGAWANPSFATALKYAVREDIEDWEQAWERFKDEYKVGKPRPISKNGLNSDASDGDVSEEGDSMQSDVVLHDSNTNNFNECDPTLPLNDLTLHSDETSSEKNNSKPSSHNKSTDGEELKEEEDNSKADADIVYDDATQMDSADITAVLYAHDDGIDSGIFERLTPRNIKLV